MFMVESVQSSRAFARLDNLRPHKSDFHIIELFGVSGAILPLILLWLEGSVPYVCASGTLNFFRTFIWPTSILTAGAQCSYLTLTHLYSALLNIPSYLVLGGLLWLGLQPPRSKFYLSVVGIIYLSIVVAADCWEWLLTT